MNTPAANAPESGAAPKHETTIIVDDVKHLVRPGSWIVSDLKQAVGVDPAKVLAEVTPNGLKDLADDAKIGIHENEQFISHARTGGSS
jgi:hypothetical protein